MTNTPMLAFASGDVMLETTPTKLKSMGPSTPNAFHPRSTCASVGASVAAHTIDSSDGVRVIAKIGSLAVSCGHGA